MGGSLNQNRQILFHVGVASMGLVVQLRHCALLPLSALAAGTLQTGESSTEWASVARYLSSGPTRHFSNCGLLFPCISVIGSIGAVTPVTSAFVIEEKEGKPPDDVVSGLLVIRPK